MKSSYFLILLFLSLTACFSNLNKNEGCDNFIESKNYTQALSCLKSSLKENKERLLPLIKIASCYYKLEKYDSSIFYLKQRKIEYPESLTASYYVNLGGSFQKINNLDSMKKYFEIAIALDTSLFDPLFQLGYSFFEIKKYQTAIPYLRKALNKQPKNYSLILMLADSYYYNSEWEKALAIYLYLDEFGKSEKTCHLNNIGHCYYELNEIRKAKKYLIKGIKSCNHEKQIAIKNLISLYDSLNEKDSIKYYIDLGIF